MNVVLQKNNVISDDGLLYVFYRKQNKVYINIAAEHEHEELQAKMIEALFQFFINF